MSPAPEASRDGPLLDVRGLEVRSRIGDATQTIVSGIDLHVERGEAIAIVGESGSGKSITARVIASLLPEGLEANGEVLYKGRDVLALGENQRTELHGTEIGMILQDPFTMLNPLRRCGVHITELLREPSGRRPRRRALRDEATRRLAEVRITDPSVADQYPFQLSGGMRQRVAIAAMLARDPTLLIADEPSTALDVTTQADVLALLRALQQARQMSLILITHDLRVAFATCDRVYVLYAGTLLEVGNSQLIEEEPLHPYTLGLLMSEPPADKRVARLAEIEGGVPRPDDVSGCCAFASRCSWTMPVCSAQKPALRELAAGRETACVRVDEIRGEMRVFRERLEAPVPPVVWSAADPLVQITNLTKVFESSKRRVVALDAVSIAVGRNESVGLVGESGSGKSTLARCLLGLETPTSGTIIVDGIDATSYEKLPGGERRRLRSTVQIVFQDPYSSLNPVRSVGSVLAEVVRAHAPDTRDVQGVVGDLLQRVGLQADYAKRKPIALSGGERQRVAIARALAASPKLIVCDEPVSALDVSVQAQILNLFRELRDELGISYLFISHDLAVIRQAVERAYVLLEGKVVEEGSTEDLFERPQHDYTRRLLDSIPRSPKETAAAG